MKSRRPSAFTLIELLTVIAIIGILAAILIPVVGRLRETSRAAKCTSNLRNLAGALLLAAQDNRGVFPWGFDGNNANANERPWMFKLSQNYSLAWRADATNRMNNEIYNCPTTTRVGTGVWPATRPDYGANATVLGDTRRTGSRPRNLNTLRDPSRLVLVADCSDDVSVLGGEFLLNGLDFATAGFPPGMNSVGNSRPAPRHPAPSGANYAGGSFNAAFVDGHVERVSTSDSRLATLESRRLMFVAQ